MRRKKIDWTYVGIVCFFFAVFLFTFYADSDDWILSFCLAAGITITIFIAIKLNDHFGRKRHKSILSNSVFDPLKFELGFLLEELNEGKYSGYKGVHEKFFFRVYYNWDTLFSSDFIWREYCVMIYFEPLLIEHGDFNMPELDRLNKKYGNKNITFEPRQKIFVEVSHIRLHHAYSIFTSYRRLKRKIDLLIDIVLTEGLQPISEGDVQKLIIQDPYLHGPTIESFTEGLVED